MAGSSAVQNATGAWFKDLLQAPLSIKSFLDGRAVGEWHLTVGNPMNPVAVIGNLCLKSTTIKFAETLGADDFPTEVTFKVTLEHGRPRAKQDIESMFNLGAGDMSFTPLPAPSSAFNSYGERNSITANRFNNIENSTPQAQDDSKSNNRSAQFIAETSDPTTSGKSNIPKELGDIQGNLAGYFKDNVKRSYGVKFASSNALPDYFINLKTKD